MGDKICRIVGLVGGRRERHLLKSRRRLVMSVAQSDVVGWVILLSDCLWLFLSELVSEAFVVVRVRVALSRTSMRSLRRPFFLPRRFKKSDPMLSRLL